ncbi:L-lactate MFS transporter [Photobacterium kagoshimensis]|uniref:L-lactate MFS transporter n=1 Tax=Photobacterium kagoshimensis TaxID=2910242 RepID=UPI003D0D893B
MQPSANQPNRLWTLLGTILTQFALGSVYTWSLFNAPLASKLETPVSQVAFSFGILSLSLAVASSLSGKLQERFGVRKVTISAGIMLGLSLIITSYAPNLMVLYVVAGFLVGFADGTGYLMTLSNCVKFFPERKGVASACAIGAYGLGSLGFKYINMYFLTHSGVEMTFSVWGIIAMCCVVVGGIMMRDAPIHKEASQNKSNQAESQTNMAAPISEDFTLAEAFKTPQFWMLSLIFLTVCMSGLYVIGVAKDIGENFVHLNSTAAATSVAIIAVCNLSGRLVLGVLSDKIARIRVISIALVICLVGVVCLRLVALEQSSFYLAIACIAFSFGGTITVYPSLVSDFFGLNNLTKNYGFIYLGFGIGSFVGSVIAAFFGGFTATFSVMLALVVISIVFSLTVKLPSKAQPLQPAMC